MTIKVAGKICTQKSQIELVKMVKESLPDFFGFEAAGILLRDQKTDVVFSLNELNKDELDHRAKMPDVNEEFQTEENILRETNRISYPCTLGVSGRVFQTKQIYIQENHKRDQLFNSDVDN